MVFEVLGPMFYVSFISVADLLKSRCISKDRTYEMKSHIVNLMTNYPVTLYGSLVPFKDSQASSEPDKNGCSASVTLKCKGSKQIRISPCLQR